MEDDDIGHDYDDCGSIGAEPSIVEPIVTPVVGEASQKSKGKGKGKGNSDNRSKGRAGVRFETKVVAVHPWVRALMDSNEASKKAGSAAAPAVPVPTGRRRQRSNAKPRSAASTGNEVPSLPEPSGRKPPSASKMDSVEIVLRSPSPTRSRVRGGGAKTGDEKTMTDSEGKVRKRRKVAARAAA